MVNGRDAHMFNQEHSSITDTILLNKNVNKPDRELFAVISEGLNSIEISKRSRSDRNSVVSVRPVADTFAQKPSSLRHL